MDVETLPGSSGDGRWATDPRVGENWFDTDVAGRFPLALTLVVKVIMTTGRRGFNALGHNLRFF